MTEAINKLSDTLMWFIPAGLILFAMYFTLKKFLDHQQKQKSIEARLAVTKDTLTLRLQAYERIILFLERISPNSLLPRVHGNTVSASQFQQELLATIRAEFEHNYSQQIYVTDTAWKSVCDARDQMTRLINQCGIAVSNEKGNSIQLSSHIFDVMVKSGFLPTQNAIDVVKAEARKLIG